MWFHAVEILVLILGVALPAMRSASYLKGVLKNFPPHRHINGSIIYPAEYAPTDIERTK
jgi:hypothetical protein